MESLAAGFDVPEVGPGSFEPRLPSLRQRFDNFERALQVLERGVELARQRPLSELEQQGLNQ